MSRIVGETRLCAGMETNSPLPTLLDINAVADYLGVTTRLGRRLVAERRIPFLKWGRLLRFDPAEIARWLDEARIAVRHGGRR